MAITEVMIESLRGSLNSSKLITPHDEWYTQSLKRWSECAEKKAGIVVLPTTVKDVSTTVIFATSNGLEVAVCGGGHSTSGSSSSEGGVVIDLSKMQNVIVRPEEMCVVAEGGCLWEEVDVEAGRFGLATVGRTVNHTGVGGLTLGGGYGWLSGKYGLAIDNLLSVQVVLADGRIVVASETENQDLFWVMRGAGQSFGVATEFTFRAHPQPNSVWAGVLMFTTEKLDAVLEFTNTIPDASENGDNGMILGLAAPPTLGGAMGIIALVYHNGSASSGERYYKPLLDLKPVLNTVAQMPYSQLNGLTKYFATHGDRKITNGVAFITPLSPTFVRELIDEFTAFLANVPEAARSIILMEYHDQRKICEVSHTATAFANRGLYQNIVICPRWTSIENDAFCRAWAKTIGTKYENEKIRMEKEGHSVDVEGAGQYGNYDGFGSPAKKIFGPNYEKLVRLNTKYDPSTVFNKNMAFVPGEGGSANKGVFSFAYSFISYFYKKVPYSFG